MKIPWPLAALVCLAGGCASSTPSRIEPRSENGPAGTTIAAPSVLPGEVPPAPGRFSRGRVITPSGATIEVEVADEDAEQQRGLQYRDRVEEGHGMLFVYPAPGVHPFWMYLCLIPLDILWLDGAGKVIHIERALPPCGALPCPGYGPDQPSTYVLELAAGGAQRMRIARGDRLELLFASPPKLG